MYLAFPFKIVIPFRFSKYFLKFYNRLVQIMICNGGMDIWIVKEWQQQIKIINIEFFYIKDHKNILGCSVLTSLSNVIL